ncbi:MAG: ubiquinol-cytochrome c reductase iron-sulfur subunit [Candidatus Binataceae bacterium]
MGNQSPSLEKGLTASGGEYVGAAGEKDITRRQWLGRFFWAATSLVGAGLALPVVVYFLGPILKVGRPSDVKLGKIDDFPIGVPQRVEVTIFRVNGWVTEQARQIAWVLRKSNGVVVFDPHCTHLGCAYHWSEDVKQFQCPCHDGRFDIDGCVVGGPPPRPLDTYPCEVRDGVLYAMTKPQRRASCRSAKA